MYCTFYFQASIDNIIKFLNDGAVVPNVDVVVAPPAPYLSYVKEKVKSGIEVSAQNCYKVKQNDIYYIYVFFRSVL